MSKKFSFDAIGRMATADDRLIGDMLDERYGPDSTYVAPEVDRDKVRERIANGDRTTQFYRDVEAARKRNV
jgi:hypothetical protein